MRYQMHLSAPKGGVCQMLRNPEGQWVAWEDYARLKAEVERLRKAGDAMAEQIYNEGKVRGVTYVSNIDEWNAAKEGKQPK